MNNWFRIISGLLAGLLFGLGLAASGMTDTHKVIGFLSIFGDWDSDLLFVMGGAVLTSGIGFALLFKRKTPLFDEQFFFTYVENDRSKINDWRSTLWFRVGLVRLLSRPCHRCAGLLITSDVELCDFHVDRNECSRHCS